MTQDGSYFTFQKLKDPNGQSDNIIASCEMDSLSRKYVGKGNNTEYGVTVHFVELNFHE